MFDTVMIIKKQINIPAKIYKNTIGININHIKNTPNIYFLLFDEYAGLQSLKDSFQYDNSLFYNKLKSDSFTILPTFSNYSITQFSMASMLNMNYIKNIKDSTIVGWEETQKQMLDIKNADIFVAFKNIGYTIKSFSLFEIGANKSIGGNQFLLGHKRVLTNKILHNVLLKDIGYNFVTGKYATNFIQKIFLGDLPIYNNKVEIGLNYSIKNIKSPQFVYAHFLMPHFPFLFDSLGKKVPNNILFKKNNWLNKGEYISYLKFCNSKIIEYEQLIKNRDPNAIIILMSDHGYRYSPQNLSTSTFNNFCAVRNLQNKNPPSSISNVNFFRYVLNSNFNQLLPYLNDKTIALFEK
ncbi:MAG: hypothetical protein HOO89_00975 [Ferruginibacter sp.]|nr:hypothetical protein [Ferruginibacter sp.]